jgi:hypothetical protein
VVKNIVLGVTMTCSKKGPLLLTHCQNPAIFQNISQIFKYLEIYCTLCGQFSSLSSKIETKIYCIRKYIEKVEIGFKSQLFAIK